MRHIRHRILGIVCLVFVLFLGKSGVVHAEPEHKLLQIDVVEDQIIAYFESSDIPKEAAFQIAQTPCEKIEVTGMGETPFGYHTIILVDNSLSVTDENRELFLEILREYMKEKQEEELVSLAIYGEDIQFLVERASGTEELLAAVDMIDQQNRDTYLTDVMYEMLDSLKVGELTRFIIISDGVDNKSIGITKEELMEKLKENRHQVFTVGHIYHKNEEQLENMFALSRATNGRKILLDEVEDTGSTVSILRDVKNVYRVAVEIPKEMCDGSSKSVLFTFSNGGEASKVRADIRMPFSIRETEPEADSEPEIESEPESEPEPIAEPNEEPEPKKNAGMKDLLLTGAAVVVIILAVGVLIVSKRTKKEKSSPKEKPSKREKPLKEMQIPTPPQKIDMQEEETIMLGAESENSQMPIGGNCLLILQDRKETGRVFRFPLKQKVIVGRNVDKVNLAIDYNRTVSGQHCEIYIRGGRCYIKDLASANKTRVNGHVIMAETEIATGTVISLGTAEFVVQIVPM